MNDFLPKGITESKLQPSNDWTESIKTETIDQFPF